MGALSWLTVCDVLDGKYNAIDTASKNGEAYNYIDCFHETFAEPGECQIVALSFKELLERALRGGGNQVYYLQEGFIGYGDGRELTAENATMRIENPETRRKGWIMKFTHRGVRHHKFFSDDEYGGKLEAFEALRSYIIEL